MAIEDYMSRKKAKLKWDDKLLGTFLKICVQEVHAGNRPKTHLSKVGWYSLLKKMKQATGKDIDRKQVKNKWDGLKKDWLIWCRLLENEELEWDTAKKTIDASEEWWEMKLTEIPEAAKFKDKGLPFAEEMKICFGDIVDISDTALTTSSRVLHGNVRRDRQGIQELSEEDDDSIDHENDRRDTQEIEELGEEEDGSADLPTRQGMKDLHVDGIDIRLSKRLKTNTKMGPSATKEGGFASRIQLDRTCNVNESRSSAMVVENEVDDCSVLKVMATIRAMPEFQRGSDLFFVATRLMLKKSYREMFVALKEPEDQLEWLRSYSRSDAVVVARHYS